MSYNIMSAKQATTPFEDFKAKTTSELNLDLPIRVRVQTVMCLGISALVQRQGQCCINVACTLVYFTCCFGDFLSLFSIFMKRNAPD